LSGEEKVDGDGEGFADAAGGARLARDCGAGQQLGGVGAGVLGAVEGSEQGWPG
jgi:hypothetical protein